MKLPKRSGQGHQRQQEDLGPYNYILHGSSPEAQTKLLRILRDSGIPPNDPMFLAIAAVTNCEMTVGPIPKELEGLREDIRVVLKQVEASLNRHEELNYNFYVTAERLSTILNQKLFEIERYQNRQKDSISLSFRAVLLWCLVTSAIGGIAGALLIATVMIIAAVQ